MAVFTIKPVAAEGYNYKGLMMKGAARRARAREICRQMATPTVTRWIGAVDELSSSNDGHGVLKIRLTAHLTVGTTNNALSDSIGMSTLIDPNSLVFQNASKLHKGQIVRFSGSFEQSRDDCFNEESLTQEGSMDDPDFLFQFSEVEGF